MPLSLPSTLKLRPSAWIRLLFIQAVAASQAFHQLWEVARRDVQRRIYLAAGWAAALGIGAAALVYGLR
mgnify:CR=1 FL=1